MKNLVYIGWNASQHGHFSILSSIFARYGYVLHFLSAEACAGCFYESPEPCVAARLARMSPEGSGLKGIVKKILTYRPLNRFLYSLLCTLGGPLRFVSQTIHHRNLLRCFNRELNLLCRKVNAVGILHPGTIISPWESIYFPQTSLPVIAFQTYVIIDQDCLKTQCEKDYNGQDYSSTFGRKLTNVLVPHWGWRSHAQRKII